MNPNQGVIEGPQDNENTNRFVKLERHSGVHNLQQAIDGEQDEKIDSAYNNIDDPDTIKNELTVNSDIAYKQKAKKEYSALKTKKKPLKYKKQNTSLSSENHPVVAIVTWCVENLVTNIKCSDSHNFLATPAHFKTFAKLSFRRQPFFQRKNPLPTYFDIHICTPDIFCLLRKKFNVTEKCFKNSLGQDVLINFDEKRKTFLSPDGLFRVTLIDDEELERFQRILQRYYQHIVNRNGETCLPKYVCLLIVSFKKKTYNVLVTKTTILPTEYATRIFDAKGSILRKNAMEHRGALETGSIKLCFDDDDDEKKKLHKVIAQDIKFLNSCGAIHYQLFIAEYQPEELEAEYLEFLDTYPGNYKAPKEEQSPKKSSNAEGDFLSEEIYKYTRKSRRNRERQKAHTANQSSNMSSLAKTEDNLEEVSEDEDQTLVNLVTENSTKKRKSTDELQEVDIESESSNMSNLAKTENDPEEASVDVEQSPVNLVTGYLTEKSRNTGKLQEAHTESESSNMSTMVKTEDDPEEALEDVKQTPVNLVTENSTEKSRNTSELQEADRESDSSNMSNLVKTKNDPEQALEDVKQTPVNLVTENSTEKNRNTSELQEADRESDSSNMSNLVKTENDPEEASEDVKQSPVNLVKGNSKDPVDSPTLKDFERPASLKNTPEGTDEDGASREKNGEEHKDVPETNEQNISMEDLGMREEGAKKEINTENADEIRIDEVEVDEDDVCEDAVDDARLAEVAESNETQHDPNSTLRSGIQFHRKNLQCHHGLQSILGNRNSDSSGLLYCFEFRNILKTYTCKRRVERAWHRVRLGHYAKFASTVPPGEYARRLSVFSHGLFKKETNRHRIDAED